MILDLDHSNWERVSFGDVVRNVNEYFDADRDGVLPYVAGPHVEPGELKPTFGSTDDVDFPPTFKRMFIEGDVLLHSRGIGKLAVVDRHGVTGEKLFVLRSKDARLAQRFLPFLMLSRSAQRHMAENFTGSVNKFLNWKPLADFQFDLPPLDEQHLIADFLWATEKDSIAAKNTDRALNSVLDRVVEGWWSTHPLVPIGRIAKCVTGTTPPKANQAFWDSHDVGFLTPSEVGSLFAQPPRQWMSEAGTMRARVLEKNSVAVVCIGGSLGATSVLPFGCTTNQQLTCLVGLEADDALLAAVLLRSRGGQREIQARETTTIVRKLNKSDLEKVVLPWPDGATRRQLAANLQALISAIDAAAARSRTDRELRAAFTMGVLN
ncbi:MAG: restriction endonuclease subunit S [Mycobacterium sp.]